MPEITRDQVLSAVSKGTRDGEYRICCPYCDDESFHMYCNLSKMLYHCFKCEAKGKIKSDFWVNVEKGLEEIRQEYKPKNVSIPITIEKRKEKNWIKTLPLNRRIVNGSIAAKYLYDRGLTWNQICTCLLSEERSGIYKDTVIFPIYEGGLTNPYAPNYLKESTLKYFVARRYTDQQPKYVNAPWPKDDTLFIAGNPQWTTPIIVEGIFDALAIERSMGIRAGFALLGKKATGQQLIRLAKMHSKYIIYLDDDALSHAIHLKMELETLGIPSVIYHHRLDAADLALENMEELKRGLNAATNIGRDKK